MAGWLGAETIGRGKRRGFTEPPRLNQPLTLALQELPGFKKRMGNFIISLNGLCAFG